MFDPSIFDNLKVVLEGNLYDLDREGLIHVIGRKDIIDLARMDRTFSMQYVLPDKPEISLELQLSSALLDFAVELVNIRSADHKPGCTIQLIYSVFDWQPNVDQLLAEQEALFEMWEQAVQIQQNTILSNLPRSAGEIIHPDMSPRFKHEIIVTLHKRIDESHISQFSSLLEHTLTSINSLHRLLKPFIC